MSNKDSTVIFNVVRKTGIEDSVSQETEDRGNADSALQKALSDAITARQKDAHWLDLLSDNT